MVIHRTAGQLNGGRRQAQRSCRIHGWGDCIIGIDGETPRSLSRSRGWTIRKQRPCDLGHRSAHWRTMTAIVAMNLAGILEWTEHRVLVVLLSVGIALSAVLLMWPSSTNVVAGIALAALVGQDIALHRSGSINTRWWIAAVVAMAVALLFFIAGRTGGPLCDSSSLFQGHAVWHILAATALWAYFMATTPTRRGINP